MLALLALTVVGSSALVTASAADVEQLSGIVSSVDVEAKKIAVTPTDKQLNVDVKVNSDTEIVTSAGKKMEMKELKKGDGVGISHINSVASKVVVNVKPAD